MREGKRRSRYKGGNGRQQENKHKRRGAGKEITRHRGEKGGKEETAMETEKCEMGKNLDDELWMEQ